MALPVPEMLKTVIEEEGLEISKPIVSNRNTYVAASSALLFIFLLGMVVSYPAPATVDMNRPGSRFRGITPDEITWIGSLTNLGGIPGNILAGYFAHKFGRKAVMMFFAPLFMLGWLMIAYAPSVEWIYAGRVTSGFCTGLFMVAVPAYVSEISPPNIRGRLSSGFGLAVSSGICIVIGLGNFLRWSWLAVASAILVACATFLMLFMPESPPWLVRESRIGEAGKALRFLRGKHSDTKVELQVILGGLAEQEVKGMTLKDILNPEVYKPLAISLSLIFFHQGSGMGPLLVYTVEVLQNAHTSMDSTVAATIVGAVQVVACVLCGGLIDRSGRRKLYITSGIFTTLFLVVLGAYSLMLQKGIMNTPALGYIPLISFIAYIFAFFLGMGTIPFVMMPEMVPIQFRSTLLAIASVFVSLLGFIIIKVFQNLRSILGDYGVYWTFGFLSSMSILFGYFILPETKNLTTQEISALFSKPRGRL